MDTCGDNKNIIADGVPEIEAYMKEVLLIRKQRSDLKKNGWKSYPIYTASFQTLLDINRTNVRRLLYFFEGLWYTVVPALMLFVIADSIQSIGQQQFAELQK